MIRIALLLLLVAFSASAQDIDENAPAIKEIMDKAAAHCVQNSDPTGPKPHLIVEPAAITWTDLDGGEEPNDTVIDFNYILCSMNYSLWHGSGGSYMHFVLNGETSAAWTGGNWRVIEMGGKPLILFGRHGGYCDSFGARGCVQAVVADEEGFWVVTEPLPLPLTDQFD